MELASIYEFLNNEFDRDDLYLPFKTAGNANSADRDQGWLASMENKELKFTNPL